MISYVFPSCTYHPQINNNPHSAERHPSVLGGGGERETTDFLPVPSVCFSKRQCTSIYHFSMFCITGALRATLANQALSSQTCLFLSSTRSASNLSQTPTGLLLAHSPLLSGIHFWSSLSPVAPLSPARLQGHSSLFQVRKHQQVRKSSSS